MAPGKLKVAESQPFFQHGIVLIESNLFAGVEHCTLWKRTEVKRRIFWTTLSHCCSMRQKISNKKSRSEAKKTLECFSCTVDKHNLAVFASLHEVLKSKTLQPDCDCS